MMTFEAYHNYLEETQKKLEELEHKICYRRIQLIGRNETEFVKNIDELSPEEKHILATDKILRDLECYWDDVNKRLAYVRKHANYPLEEDAIDAVINGVYSREGK